MDDPEHKPEDGNDLGTRIEADGRHANLTSRESAEMPSHRKTLYVSLSPSTVMIS